jgi:hypothetical protein
MIECKDFMAATVAGARVMANEWLTKLPKPVRVVSIETLDSGKSIRVWVAVET